MSSIEHRAATYFGIGRQLTPIKLSSRKVLLIRRNPRSITLATYSEERHLPSGQFARIEGRRADEVRAQILEALL